MSKTDHKLAIYSSHALDALIFEDLTLCEKTNKHIELHEDLPHEQVMDCLSNAHALLLPSRRGYPLSVAEAMSVGTIPIVAEYSPDVWAQIPPQLHPFVIDFRNTSELKVKPPCLHSTSPQTFAIMQWPLYRRKKWRKSQYRSELIELLVCPQFQTHRKHCFPYFVQKD